MHDEFRAKLELIKESEQDKQELDKDLRRDFIQAWYGLIEVIKPVYEVAVDVGLENLTLREYPGKRDIALERKFKHVTYELRYHPDFPNCKITLVTATPQGRRSEVISIDQITAETVKARAAEFVTETAPLFSSRKRQ